MKKISLFFLAVLSVLLIVLSGCTEAPSVEEFAGFTYIYEGDDAVGQFAITINENGTFSYFEGAASSYIGVGEWTVEENKICLTDRDNPLVNYFRFKDGKLVFIEKNSTNFTYVKVSDGDTFRSLSSPDTTNSESEK